jgi:hypothetical protein
MSRDVWLYSRAAVNRVRAALEDSESRPTIEIHQTDDDGGNQELPTTNVGYRGKRGNHVECVDKCTSGVLSATCVVN